MPSRHWWLSALGLIVCPEGIACAQATQSVTVEAKSLLDFGKQLESRGDRERATQVYEALTTDPDKEIRSEARYRLAEIAISQSRWRDAAILLRRVLDEVPEAIPARLSLARALAELGDDDAAYRELRAIRTSALPAEVVRMVEQYSEALRARRPYGASVSFAIAPNTNINNATSSDTIGTVIGDFDIDQDAKRRSGIGLAIRSHAFLRRRIGDHTSVVVRAAGNADLYRRSEFSSISAAVFAGPERDFGRVRLNAEAGLSSSWFGMKPYETRFHLNLIGARAIGRQSYVRAQIASARTRNHFNRLQSGQVWGSEVQFEHAIDMRTGGSIGVSIERSNLRDPGYSNTAWRATILGWREVGRATINGTFAYGALRADRRLSLFPESRKDTYLAVSLGATMRHVQLMGFSPLFRFTAERNKSNIEFHDFTRRRAEFGLVRAF